MFRSIGKEQTVVVQVGGGRRMCMETRRDGVGRRPRDVTLAISTATAAAARRQRRQQHKDDHRQCPSSTRRRQHFDRFIRFRSAQDDHRQGADDAEQELLEPAAASAAAAPDEPCAGTEGAGGVERDDRVVDDARRVGFACRVVVVVVLKLGAPVFLSTRRHLIRTRGRSHYYRKR